MTPEEMQFLYKLANELEAFSIYHDAGNSFGGVDSTEYPFRDQAKELRAFIDKQKLEKSS